MAITARELARRLGLSETAVSLALNNKPGVSTETRRLVISEATRCGYDFSRIKSRQHTGRLALIIGPYFGIAESGNTFCDDVVCGVRETCTNRGYTVSSIRLSPSELNGDGLERVIAGVCQMRTEGVLLLGADIPEATIHAFLDLKVPVVLMDQYASSIPCCAVTIDNLEGGRMAARHLCDTYLQTPGYLRCRYRTANFDERITGFMEIVRDKGFSHRSVRVLTLSPSTEGAYGDMLSHLDENSTLPRCLFAETDQLALGAARAIVDYGLRIPDDVAIMGFDNVATSRAFDPPLTTIDFPKAFMGVEAAHRLINLIEHPTDYVTNTRIAVSLVKRKSA